MTKIRSRPPPTAIETASSAEASEAIYFARKCGLAPDEALRLIREAQETPALEALEGGKQKR
ncbi:hypothetical protein [Mesorhizobium sp.]|uniref:hypothetical protein n=1 Tax=Mesorhizobium sp. TaxID=1871066 RepID=UPI0025DF493C|nr:hypothetical protein [Mesorhizobium sp.]